MRIGVCAPSLEFEKPTGIGVYARELLQALVAVGPRSARYWVLPHSIKRRTFDVARPSPDTVAIQRVFHPNIDAPILNTWLRRVTLPLYCRILNLDIYHSFRDFRLPDTGATKTLITVHDLLRFKEGEWFSFSGRERRHQRARVYKGLTAADAVIAVSHTTKKDICDIFNIDGDKIHVIYSGVPSDRYVMDRGFAESVIANEYDIECPFVLAIGTNRRKNPVRLIKAFAKVRKQTSVGHQLVFVGESKRYIDEIADNLGVSTEVRALGYVPERLMTPLYNCASVLAYPSLYEGFGLPILEAMACGTPVVTSSRSSMPEVAGEAAILVNEKDSDSIATGIGTVLTDPGRRGDLIDAGFDQVKHFSWHRTAGNIMKVYKELMQ